MKYLVIEFIEAFIDRNLAVRNNEKMKDLLDLFQGKPETYQLKENVITGYLGFTIPDIKSVLRCTESFGYKPATAAMSLVLRAGIPTNADPTFELIRESVAKINKTI